jgi:hypothetical protein
MSFDTPITCDGPTLTGPLRRPAQMLADQEYAGHTSVHDDDTAAALGLAAPRSRGRRTSARSTRWRSNTGAGPGSSVAA